MGGDDSHFQTKDQIKLLYSSAGGLKGRASINDLVTVMDDQKQVYKVYTLNTLCVLALFIYYARKSTKPL